LTLDPTYKRGKEKMKKLLSIAITIILVSSIFFIALPTQAIGPAIADVEPVDWKSGLAGNVPMPTLTPEKTAEFARANSIMTAQSSPEVGTTVIDWYLEAISIDYRGADYPYMTLRAKSENVEVWVAQNESLMYLPGDPRNADPLDWYVNDAMCQFIATEFNNLIYPTDTTYFGKPFDRDGTNNIFQNVGFPAEYWNWIATDNPQRVIIKIFNIIDNSFFDPTYPSYVVGFFSPTYKGYYDRNMIHIDNWKYWQRLGAEGSVWYSEKGPVTRPYVYDSTVAHEFQHLIHDDYNPEDPSFMNEGCSMYAELLCGYGIDPAYLNYYFYAPDNSLTEWGDLSDYDILADYGESALWVIYLSDHYGGSDTIRSFVQNGKPGIEGVDYVLAEYGYTQTFDDVFHDWRLANLIRASSGPYGYSSLDLNAPEIIPVRRYDVSGFPVPWTMGTSFGNTFAINGYDTGKSRVGPYGTDYVAFKNWNKPGVIGFDGDDEAAFGWQMTTDGWWSSAYGTGVDLIDTSLMSGSIYVNPKKPTLTIVTRYGIETGWDFGFVQVSTDGGATWTSLANKYTTSDHDPDAYSAITDNLPGLTGYSLKWPNFITMDFSLKAYAGKNVMIRFRYMTDWATTYEGWWIRSATLGGSALTLTPPSYPKASYQVTAVKAFLTPQGKLTYTLPEDLILDKDTWTGESNTFAKNPTYVVLIVSPTMPTGAADYQFRAYPK
jgi:hypothetical protein